MTEYLESQPNYRVEQYKRALQDKPVVLAEEEFDDNEEEKKTYYCNYCNCNLIKLSADEYYCNRCSISQYPAQEEVQSNSRITTPTGPNDEALISYPPDPNEQFLSDKKPEYKGTFKELERRGIKITNYEEHIPK